MRSSRAPKGTVIGRLARVAMRCVLAAALGSIALVVLFRFVDPPLTPLMVIRAVEAKWAGHPAAIDRTNVALAAVSPHLLRAVIASEDARFFEHHGIDLEELRRARAYNERQRGRRVRGASTISMQCARSVFLWPARTYVRKAFELYFTGLIELLWSKQRILEVYMNVVEWGDGVYGAEAAARRFFRVSASRLTARQAALLAAALPSPRRSNPAAPSPYLGRRAARLEKLAPSVPLSALD